MPFVRPRNAGKMHTYEYTVVIKTINGRDRFVPMSRPLTGGPWIAVVKGRGFKEYGTAFNVCLDRCNGNITYLQEVFVNHLSDEERMEVFE